MQILLMVLFGIVKDCIHFHLSRYFSKPGLCQSQTIGFILSRTASNSSLSPCIDHRPILRASIIALAEALCGIMFLPEDSKQRI